MGQLLIFFRGDQSGPNARDFTINHPQLAMIYRTLRLLPVLLVLISFCPPSGAADETSALTGNWQGTLNAGGVPLRLAFSITMDAGKLAGTLTSLDQGGAKIPLTAVSERSRVVRLEAASIGGGFQGKMNKQGDEIAGTWSQGGSQLPLTVKRSAAEVGLNRPQEPKRPFPYREEEVNVPTTSSGVTLAGTFTVPHGVGPHPAVVLITGSGPQDRDEAIMGHRPFLLLADHLTRAGIAVLRCDDRGVGRSTGDFSQATHADFTRDAMAALSWLRTRKNVHPRKTGFIGHSEGGIVAPLAAVRNPDDVAFMVLLAGVGVPMDEVLIRQNMDLARQAGASEDAITKIAGVQREIFAQLKTSADSAAVEKLVLETRARQMREFTAAQQKALGLSQATIEAQSRIIGSPWFRQLLAYDPRPTLRKVKCPVLALNGEKDVQVAAEENLGSIRRELEAGGNTKVKTVLLPGLNHLFQTCRTGAVSEYGEIEETLSAEVLTLVSTWIGEVAAGIQ